MASTLDQRNPKSKNFTHLTLPQHYNLWWAEILQGYWMTRWDSKTAMEPKMKLNFIHVHACSEGHTIIPAVELVLVGTQALCGNHSLKGRCACWSQSAHSVSITLSDTRLRVAKKMMRCCAGCDPRNLMDGGFMGKSSGNSSMPQLSKFFKHPARFAPSDSPNSPRYRDICLKKWITWKAVSQLELSNGFFCSEKPPKAWTMMSPPMYQAVTVFPMPTQDASSVWVLVSSHHKMPFQNICVQRPRLNVFNGILKNPSVPAQTSHTCHPFCKCVFSPFSSRRKIKRWEKMI